MMRPNHVLVVLGAAMLAGGCMVHRVKSDPEPLITPPEAYRAAAGEATASDRWWKDFGDAGLEASIDRALAGNLDLRRAFARLLQADALARQGKATLFPTLDGSLGVSRTRSNFFAGERLRTTRCLRQRSRNFD